LYTYSIFYIICKRVCLDHIEAGADALSDIEVYYNSDKDGSVELYSEVSAFLAAMQPRIFTVNSSPDKVYSLYDSSAYFGKFLGNFIPMMVFMAVFMVCMNLSANAVAGDKENVFLNTMLITPVKRSSIAAGKSISIFVIAVIASISAFAVWHFRFHGLRRLSGWKKALLIGEAIIYPCFLELSQLPLCWQWYF
jgi:ABC-type Na+ efflux pump permease subunit